MTRRKAPPSIQPKQSIISRAFLFLILVLIAIGNAVKTIILFPLTVLFSMGTAIGVVIQKTSTALLRLFQKTVSTSKKTKTPPVSTKKSRTPIVFPTLHIPRISVSFHLPVIRMPVWKFPSLRVHTRPKKSVLRDTLESPGTPASKRVSSIRSFMLGVVLTVVFVFVPYNTWLFLTSLPNPQLLTQRDLEVSTKILDRNGQLLYEIYVDQNRTPVKLEDIPLVAKQATIAIEDANFYHHPGFSVRGMIRALSEILVHKNVQGGSTITQQLIKSALLSPEITIIRKTKEIILAFWAEQLYSKDQILEMYLNQVPYGGTAWGIESAAQTYFGKSIQDLTLAEVALLAGLPAAPSEYSPFGNHPEKAFIRQKEVLRRMTISGYITEKERQEAINTPLRFIEHRVGIRAPHFVMYIKEQLEKMYGTRAVERGGLRVRTSLDLSIQEHVEEIVKAHIDTLGPLLVGNGAALVTDPRTGDILAMVGSRDYFDEAHDGNVNVTTALRQPGSSIKVLTYATALEQGITAATIINDAPITYQSEGGTPYSPVNYDGIFHGPVPLRYALANSYNIPAVKTLNAIGIPAMLEKGKLMGINSWNDHPERFGLSLTLGGADVTMLEMAGVYGTFANMGKRQDLRPILEITDYTGRTVKELEPSKTTDVFKPEVAWIMADILSDNAARTQAFGPNSALVIPGKTVSVKTGTTNDKRDNWTAGFTPSYAVVVWVGNNDNSPMHPTLTSGITGASPIWHDIFVYLLENKEEETLPKPQNVVSIPCYFGKVEYFITGTEPPGGRCTSIPTITPTPNAH